MQSPINYFRMLDNTNVLEAHRLVSAEFGKGATSVNITFTLNGQKHETEIQLWENVVYVFSEMLEEELHYNILDDIKIEFVSCTSDADDWKHLYQ